MMPPLNVPLKASVTAVAVVVPTSFWTEVRNTALWSGSVWNWSVSTPMIFSLSTPSSAASAAEPWPTLPATGMTTSAPSSLRFLANALPSSSESKLPVNRPSFLAGSQPSTFTDLLLTLL